MMRLKEMGKAHEFDMARTREETERAYKLKIEKQRTIIPQRQTKQSHLG